MTIHTDPPLDRRGEKIYLYDNVLRAEDTDHEPEEEDWVHLESGTVIDYVDRETVRVRWPGFTLDEVKARGLVRWDPPRKVGCQC